MNDAPLYTYRLSGRRRMTGFALGVGLIMLATGIAYNAPWYFLLPVILAGTLALWAVIANPQAGSILTTTELLFFNRGQTGAVRIADIASMTVKQWSDGPDTVTLRLFSGRVVHVPGLCADSALAMAMRKLGVRESDAT